MKSFQTLFSIAFLLTTLFIVIGCESEEDVDFNASLTLEFQAIANGQPLEFNTTNYSTASGSVISIDRMKFYLSNLQLINSETGEAFVEQDGYHLISLNDQEEMYSFTIENLRSDFKFGKIQFAIGVDADKNASIDNVGDLDPTNDMAWNWNTGYKFFLMEGLFYPGVDQENKGLVLHIGLDRNFKTLEFLTDNPIDIVGLNTLHFTLDGLAPFNSPNEIDLKNKSAYKVDEDSDKIAENYANGLIRLSSISR